MEQMTPREAHALEHLHKAEELEVTLVEYCRSFDLDVKEIYSAKQSLAKKGWLVSKPAPVEEDTLADFLEVKVAAPAVPSDEPVYRIHCPGGLKIECTSWPAVQWIAKLAGCVHVPA